MSFALFLDEDVDPRLAVLLGHDGFDVLTTTGAGRANRGLSDDDQLGFAAAEQREIFTHNARDFEPLARLWAKAGRRHFGIIVSTHAPVWDLRTGHRLLQDYYPSGIQDLCIRLPGCPGILSPHLRLKATSGGEFGTPTTPPHGHQAAAWR